MRPAVLALVVCAIGCGRFRFEDRDARDGGDGGGGDDATDAIDAPDSMIGAAAYVKPATTNANDVLGYSLALSADGQTLAVGAYGEQSNATGVNGDATDNSANLSGAVFVFVRSGNAWVQQAYLKASNTGTADVLGFTVAISADGNTIVAGAPDEDGGATTINGNGNDDSKFSAGAAYVFTRTGTAWSQQAYLKAANSETGDNFGGAVAISADGNTVGVGAYTEDGLGGPTPDPLSNAVTDSGAAYVFTRSGTVWTQAGYLKAQNAEPADAFGFTLAIAGDGSRIAVAATSEASGALGVNGNANDNSQPQSGAVYLFRRQGASYLPDAYLKASNTDGGDFFGNSVALSSDGNTLAVSAEGEDGSSTGVGGPQVEGAGQAGAVYVFEHATQWAQTAYIKATNTDADDRFGRSIALAADGSTLVVGAALEDSAQTGVGASGTDNSASEAGAAYVYTRAGGVWTPSLYLKATNTAVGDQFGAIRTPTRAPSTYSRESPPECPATVVSSADIHGRTRWVYLASSWVPSRRRLRRMTCCCCTRSSAWPAPMARSRMQRTRTSARTRTRCRSSATWTRRSSTRPSRRPSRSRTSTTAT
jgi:hypothetical protein